MTDRRQSVDPTRQASKTTLGRQLLNSHLRVALLGVLFLAPSAYLGIWQSRQLPLVTSYHLAATSHLLRLKDLSLIHI